MKTLPHHRAAASLAACSEHMLGDIQCTWQGHRYKCARGNPSLSSVEKLTERMKAISFSTRALSGQLQFGRMTLRPLPPCKIYMKELGTREETEFLQSAVRHFCPALSSTTQSITGPSSRATEEESCVAQGQKDPLLSVQGPRS